MKIVDEIKKNRAELQKVDQEFDELLQLEKEQLNNGASREEIEKNERDLSYCKKQVDILQSKIRTGIEQFILAGLKKYDPTVEKELESQIFQEAGRGLAILRAVLEATQNGDHLRMLDDAVNRNVDFPVGIKNAASGHKAEADKIVGPYLLENKKADRFSSIQSQPDGLKNLTKRIFGAVMRGNFEHLEV